MGTQSDTSPDRALLAALERVGLLPSAEQYRECWRDVYARGTELRRSLSADVGQRLWDRALPPSGDGRMPFDTVRILGFGHGLTDFIGSSLTLNAADRASVNELGALANFIVCFYDYALDRSDAPVSTLPEWALHAMIARRPDLRLALARHFGPPEQKLMTRLVRRWFHGVSNLARRHEHNDLLAIIHRAVLSMYRSERAAPTTPVHSRRLMLRRKNALPFVVMGLPAWLAVADVDAAALRDHLRWTYRLGLFLGAIDDANDLQTDLETGQANQFLLQTPPSVAAVAARGVSINTSWYNRAICDRRDDPRIANMLTAVIASWFGGSTAGTVPSRARD